MKTRMYAAPAVKGLIVIVSCSITRLKSKQNNIAYSLFDRGVILQYVENITICLLGYERVYLPLHQVADTPFHIQGNGILCNMNVVQMMT